MSVPGHSTQVLLPDKSQNAKGIIASELSQDTAVLPVLSPTAFTVSWLLCSSLSFLCSFSSPKFIPALLSQRCHMALRPSPLQTQFSVPAPFALHTALHQLLPWLFISFLSHFSFRDQILLPHSLTVTTLHTRTCATLGTAQCPRNSLGHLGYQPRAGKILYSSDCRVRNNPAMSRK